MEREDGIRLRERRYVIQAPDDTTARYLRVEATDPPGEQDTFSLLPENARHDQDARVKEFRGDLAALTEISVWKPRPRSERPDESGADATSDERPDGSSTEHASDDSDSGTSLAGLVGVAVRIWLGLVLVGVVGAVVVVWLARIRRRR